MFWKETFRIGVDIIDTQHKELFERTEQLFKEVQASGVEHKQKCIDAILFLKKYAVQHFADEEAYQKSINYADFEAHKQLHVGFVKTVLEQEKKMVASDFSAKDVKEFTGMLMAWLLYHVADKDQKIGKTATQTETLHNHRDIIRYSVSDVLHKMASFDTNAIKIVDKHHETFDDSIVIEMELTGEVKGYIAHVYPISFIKNLINAMMGFEPQVIDELEISALFEVAHIISGTICTQISKDKNISCGTTDPIMTKRSSINPDERIALDTGHGIIETDISIEYR